MRLAEWGFSCALRCRNEKPLLSTRPAEKRTTEMCNWENPYVLPSCSDFSSRSPLSPLPLIVHDAAISSPHVARDTCCFNYSTVRVGFVENTREGEF